jgi:hypothetical protein
MLVAACRRAHAVRALPADRTSAMAARLVGKVGLVVAGSGDLKAGRFAVGRNGRFAPGRPAR